VPHPWEPCQQGATHCIPGSYGPGAPREADRDGTVQRELRAEAHVQRTRAI